MSGFVRLVQDKAGYDCLIEVWSD